MYVLECGNYSDVITLSSASFRVGNDGCDMFYICDVTTFTEKVLPALFKSMKFDSFHHKMYCWGFSKQCTATRARSQSAAVASPIIYYSHYNFRKGNFALASSMTCSGPGSASNRIRSAFTSPNINVTAPMGPMGSSRGAAGDAGGVDGSHEETRTSCAHDVSMMDNGHGAPDVQLVLPRFLSQVTTGACSTIDVGSPTTHSFPRPPGLLLTEQGGYYSRAGDVLPAPASISCQDCLTRSDKNTRTLLYQTMHNNFALPYRPHQQLHQSVLLPIHSRMWYSYEHLRRDPTPEHLLFGASSNMAKMKHHCLFHFS